MSEDSVNIERNIEQVWERISKAAARCGRLPEDIHLIAVSKTIEPERIIAAIDAGIINLGENRVQEINEKYDIIKRNCNWHLIGHLQTNKVKYIIGKVKLIHSVDRLELVEEIQKRASKAGIIADILVQINVADESTKFGIKPDEARNFVRLASSYRNLMVKGVMTVAPKCVNPEEVRWVFREMREIFIDIKKENIDNIDMKYLSMGMSNDFEVAIEEGANMVRIGTAIFGKRQTAAGTETQ